MVNQALTEQNRSNERFGFLLFRLRAVKPPTSGLLLFAGLLRLGLRFLLLLVVALVLPVVTG